jgi:hypothetical protein
MVLHGLTRAVFLVCVCVCVCVNVPGLLHVAVI